MDALQQHDLQEAQQAEEKPFEIHDLRAATWAMRKLKALDNDDAEKTAAIQEQIDDLQNWLDKEKQKNADSREYLEGLLSDYLYEKRQQDPKFKVSTPYGTVSTHKVPAGVTWPSDSELVAALTKQGLNDLIRVKQEPDKKTIKKRFQFVGDHFVNPDTGIILDGVHLKEATEKTTFKINE